MQVAAKNIKSQRGGVVRRGFRCARCESASHSTKDFVTQPPGRRFIKATDGCQQLPAVYNRDYSRENCCNFRIQQFPRVRRAFRTAKRQKMDFPAKILVAVLGTVGGHNSLAVVVNRASMNYKWLHTRARKLQQRSQQWVAQRSHRDSDFPALMMINLVRVAE